MTGPSSGPQSWQPQQQQAGWQQTGAQQFGGQQPAGNQGDSQQHVWPQQGSWQQAPGSERRTGNGTLVGGIAIGLVAALLVGAVLALTEVLTFGSDEGGVSAAAIQLPAELAGLQDAATVIKAHPVAFGDKEDQQALLDQVTNGYAQATESYRSAYPGAGVTVRGYASAESKLFVGVVAVRAPSPGLASLSLASPGHPEYANIQRIATFGNVQCFVVNIKAATDGGPPAPADDQTSACHRADATLSIFVQGNATGADLQKKMVELTNSAFEAVSGTR